MNTQQAVVEQIVQNLAFEVEAVPKNESVQATSISQSTPLNVKIRVRKKDEIHVRHDDISVVDDTTRALQKIRLVNSDQTIMTFDVFMEAEFEKKPPRNLRKHIFDILRPGICLGAVDEDDYPYMPSSSYSANITEPSVATRSDGILKQTFTLSKNVYQDYTVSTQPGGQKWFFGKCKPGGCLDPPFSEDKYSYKPSTRSGPERVIPEPTVSNKEELNEGDDVECDADSSRRPSTLHDEEVKNNGRHSSIFDGGLFKKKRRSSDKSTNTKLPDKSDSILSLYQVESAAKSESAHSNSIITYPPKILSDLRISDDKTVRSRGPSEDKTRKSFNDHSEPYFIPPKGVNRIKEKETLNQRDYPNHRKSDVTSLRNSLKEPFNMPVPIPIPIPIPVPLMSNKREPEVFAKNDDISKTQGDNANVTKLIPDEELEDKINSKDTEKPVYLRAESATGDIDDNPIESSEMATSVSSNVEQPATLNKIDDKNLDETILQPYTEMDKTDMKDPTQPNKKAETEPLKMPVPVPVLLDSSDPNRPADNNMVNDSVSLNKIDDKNLDETKLQPYSEMDKTDMKDPEQPNKKSETEPLKTPVPVPTLLDSSDPNHAADNNKVDDFFSLNKIDDKNLDETKLQPYSEMDKTDMKDPEQPNKKSETEPFKTPVPVPTLLDSSDPNHAADNNKVDDFFSLNKIDDKNLDETKLQPYSEIDKTDMKDPAQPSKKAETGPLIMPVPVPVPLDCSEPNRAAESNTVNDFLQTSDMKITQSEQSLGIKTTPKIIQDTSLEESKDRNKVPSGESVNTSTPNLQYSDKEAESIPKTYLRARSDSINQKTDNVNPLTKKPTIETNNGKREPMGDEIIDEKEKSEKQNDVELKDGTNDANYQEETSDVYKIPDKDAHEITGSTNKVGRKDSLRISQMNSPDLQKSKSLLNSIKTSAASIRDKTKRSVSDNKDENKKSLRSWSKNEIDTGSGTISQLSSDKDNVAESTKPNYDDKVDDSHERFPNDGSINFITASIIIDKTEQSPNFGQLKEVYSEVNLFGEALDKNRAFGATSDPFTTEIASRFKKFDEDDVTNSTISHELIGTKSVVYDLDDDIPSTSSVKTTGKTASSDKRVILPVDTGKSSPEIVSKSPRIFGEIKGSSDDIRNKLTNKSNIRSTSVLSSIPSTSTLKSAMKKDTISVELGFHSYLNDKNERILRTFDTTNTPTRFPNDSVTVIKSQIRMSSNEIRIPVDSDHDMAIQIKKPNTNQRVSISESGFVNMIDNGRVIKQRSSVQCDGAEKRSSEAKECDNIESYVTDDNVIDLYEQELVPLQLIIKNLRDEIDVLAAQQLIFKDKIFCPNKSRLPRLVHSNRKCLGCVKK